MKNLKTVGKIFIVIIGLQAIIEFLIGVTVLFSFPTALDVLFGITYSSELDIIGIPLGLYLLLLTTLLILSIVLTLRGNRLGTTIAIIVGAVLLVYGLISYFQLGRTDSLMFDGVRGLVTIILGYVTSKEMILKTTRQMQEEK
jgi:hypothetical protein